MKIRHGFVSNSSSSSFIVARAQVGDEKFEAIKKFMRSQDIHFDGNKNYLVVDTTDQGWEEEDFDNAVKLSKEDSYDHYG